MYCVSAWKKMELEYFVREIESSAVLVIHVLTAGIIITIHMRVLSQIYLRIILRNME
jgi:hypothetical protein